jgi:hypothetical protein
LRASIGSAAIATVFVAVGIAHHDLLQVARPRERVAIERVGQQGGDDLRRSSEAVDAFEERHDAKIELRTVEVVHAGFVGQEEDLEQVADLLRGADNVGPARLRPQLALDVAHRGKEAQGFGGHCV